MWVAAEAVLGPAAVTPAEVGPSMTLSLEVAKILRDLISSRGKSGSSFSSKEVGERARTVRLIVIRVAINNVRRVAGHIGLESRTRLLEC
jgi:hypothetical protein